ncbi:MAG: putative zinc-binding peptidase [Proteobacteria bacterium]|nr:putative zinc-binding peptidase [Pseudomonadota bacterium]
MKLFRCQHCAQVLYFENTKCERCGHQLGYIPETATLSALEPDGDAWRALAAPGRPFRFCDNAQHDVCNWLVPAEADTPFCAACRHNLTIPPLDDPANVLAWRKLELAKHRLFYTLLRLGLPLQTRAEDPEHGLAFSFLADLPQPDGSKVMTGHDNGLITIALAEADDAEREMRRVSMHEPYRTLLGHFRHEVGHHYWDLLVRDAGRLEPFRALFGDEQADYAAALQRHYETGAPAGWQENFVSTYATAHPWEDFAETWAHYLHILDTLEMARAFGIRVDPVVTNDPALTTEVDLDPYRAKDIQTLIEPWLPLSFALNSLNRTMGQADVYPFILSPRVIEKLGFIHTIVHAPAAREGR